MFLKRKILRDHVIPAQWEGIKKARVQSVLVEPSPQAHLPEGIYIAWTLVQDRHEMPVRI
jgi:hypothetical protein